MGKPTKITSEVLDDIVSDYKLGLRVNELYNKYSNFGSSSTISRAIRKSGTVLRKAGPKRINCESCEAEVYRAKMCSRHYRKTLAQVKGQCNHVDCADLQSAKGLCGKHYQRFISGRPLDKSVAVWVNAQGYVCEYSPGHIQANSDGRVLEHRKVMSEHIGRRLLANENVHHINGDKTDNRLENLELWVKMQPSGQRVEDLIRFAEEILDRYKHE